MNDKKTIFKTGEITYSNEWYVKNGLDVKPVVYTNQFLKDIASNTIGSSLELTHGNEKHDVIGYVNDFDFIDDELLANISTNNELNGLGFSPEFSADFIDRGNSYEAVNGVLLKTILTDNPRSQILCNSVEENNSNGGSQMSEETISILNKQVKDLNKELAIANNKLKTYEDKISSFDELQSQIDTLTRERDEFKVAVDKLTPNAEAYEEIVNTRKTELLDKVFGKDDTAKERWRKYSLEEIEDLAKYQSVQQLPHGVSAEVGEGIGEGNNGEEGPSDFEKAMAFYKKNHNGKEPSFLNDKED